MYGDTPLPETSKTGEVYRNYFEDRSKVITTHAAATGLPEEKVVQELKLPKFKATDDYLEGYRTELAFLKKEIYKQQKEVEFASGAEKANKTAIMNDFIQKYINKMNTIVPDTAEGALIKGELLRDIPESINI